MLKFSWFKKPTLLIVSCIIIFAIGAVFVYSGRYARYIEHPARYKTNRNSVSDKSPENSLPASINNLSSENKANNQEIGTSIQSAAGANSSSEKQADRQNNSSNGAPAVQSEEKESAPANQISVALFVGDKKYEISVPEDSSVYDLMEKLQKESNFRFSGKNYPELGFFVEEINGIKNNPKNSQYWIYYVNNKSANQGISGLKIKQGDIITWKYE